MTRDTEPGNGDDANTVQSQLTALKLQQTQLFAEMAHDQKRFRRLARSVWRIQEDERRRFARDLEDGLGQSLTAILHQLEQLSTDPGLSGAAPARIDRAIDLCMRAVHETCTLARMVRPRVLDDLGLLAALNWLCRSASEGAGFEVYVDCSEDYLTDEVATLVFRVVQEALTNIAKHAGASQVIVRLSASDGQLQVLVTDDGNGCDPDIVLAGDGRSGAGLGSMRECVALFGGRLALTSSPGKGTQLRAVLPLHEALGDH